MSEERFLTVREVAERIRSSPETVRRWLRQGKLRGFRPGGTKLGYRVSEAELVRFLAASRQTPPPPTPPPAGGEGEAEGEPRSGAGAA